jgi:hypothetical protein
MFTAPSKFIFTLILFLLLSIGFSIDFPAIPDWYVPIKRAEAGISESDSPILIAAARHRARRRTVRRSTRVARRITTLPAGCTTVRRRGAVYHRCGSVYYRPYYEGTTVVYVEEEPEDE